MKIRISLLLAMVCIGHTAVCWAAPPARIKEGAASACPSADKSATTSNWTVDEVIDNPDYPGITVGLNMTLVPYTNANPPNEWQIKFSPDASASHKPPGVDILHFVCVTRGAGTRWNPKDLKKTTNRFWAAAKAIITGPDNYYGAVGYLDSVPTMVLLVVYEPSPSTNLRTFYLVLVKLEEAADSAVRAHKKLKTQKERMFEGGVIHGTENVQPMR